MLAGGRFAGSPRHPAPVTFGHNVSGVCSPSMSSTDLSTGQTRGLVARGRTNLWGPHSAPTGATPLSPAELLPRRAMRIVVPGRAATLLVARSRSGEGRARKRRESHDCRQRSQRDLAPHTADLLWGEQSSPTVRLFGPVCNECYAGRLDVLRPAARVSSLGARRTPLAARGAKTSPGPAFELDAAR